MGDFPCSQKHDGKKLGEWASPEQEVTDNRKRKLADVLTDPYATKKNFCWSICPYRGDFPLPGLVILHQQDNDNEKPNPSPISLKQIKK